jgi:DNA mismatch repair protein MutS
MMPYRFIIPRSREASTALKLVNLLDKKPKRTPTHLKKEIDAIQELYPQHILLVQVGMFYEIYGHYLDQIANVLDLRIATHKNSIGADHRFSRFAGFPMSQLRNYLVILLNNGYTVAVVEQISPHPASDIINRKVVRIMTPGTVLEDDTDLKVVDNSFLMAIYLKSERSKSLGFSWLDISTGEFYMSKSSLSQFAHELCRIHPKEVIVQKNLFECNHSIIQTLKNAGFLMTPKPETYFDCSSSKDVLLEVIVDSDPSKALMATNIKSLFKGMDITQIKSAIALLGYIRETFPSSSPVLRKPIEIISQDTMKMDLHTIQALEIVSTSREKTKKGSLISVIEQVKTAAGCRLLKSRIKAPSTIMSEINYRLDLLESFYENIDLSERMSHLLNECKDVERSLQRIHLQSAGPADLYNIISTIISVQSIKEHLHNLILASRTVEQKSALNILLSKLGNLESLSGTYHSLFDSNRKLENGKLSRMGTIQSGYSKELDQLRHRYDLLIDSREERLSQLCKLFAIKCSFAHDPNSGPLVEIGKVSEKTLQKVNQIIHSDPDLSITTMKRSSGFKFKDTQWTTIYHEIHSMETDLLQLETMIFTQACENIKQNTNQIIEMCQAVAELDIACQLGIFSRQNGYIRPHMSEKYLFFLFRTIHEVEGGRHPVVEKFQLERGNNFIANNSTLNQQNRIWLLTGPNMGGKSTFLRQW